MKFDRLEDWLSWQESLHPRTIDLGLTRCRRVLDAMELMSPGWSLITVAGTNGKGSCAALLESMLIKLGRRTGVFTSPHLIRYNERIRIDGCDADDQQIMSSFAAIDRARGQTSLSYFEFGALAAIHLFSQAEADTVVLEVGLGGRLDASNVIDPDVAIITSIAMDHQEWLGNTLDDIAREKAGIMRAGIPAIFGGQNPPDGLVEAAQTIGSQLRLRERDFFVRPSPDGRWDFENGSLRLAGLPPPAMRGEFQVSNAACAIQALAELGHGASVLAPAARAALVETRVEGRFQRYGDSPEWILDVAHNPAAARVLARNLAATPCNGDTHLLVGMVNGKDAGGFAIELGAQCDRWYPVDTPGERGIKATALVEAMTPALGPPYDRFSSIEQGCETLAARAASDDRIVIAGSFMVVGPALAWLHERVANLDTLSAVTDGLGDGSTH